MRKPQRRLDWPVISYSLPDDEYIRCSAEKILAHTTVTERGCMEWQGYCHPNKGYGMIGVKDRKNAPTHRVVYQAKRGVIPEGWDVCHTCDNPRCCNPLHLFAAPRQANVVDMINKGRGNNQKKTECPHGHEYTPENTAIDSRGWRSCRTCSRDRSRLNYQNGNISRWAAIRRDKKLAQFTPSEE